MERKKSFKNPGVTKEMAISLLKMFFPSPIIVTFLSIVLNKINHRDPKFFYDDNTANNNLLPIYAPHREKFCTEHLQKRIIEGKRKFLVRVLGIEIRIKLKIGLKKDNGL